MPGLGQRLRVLDAQTRRPTTSEAPGAAHGPPMQWRMSLVAIATGGAGAVFLVTGIIGAVVGAGWGIATALSGLILVAAAGIGWLTAKKFGDLWGVHALLIAGLAGITADLMIRQPAIDNAFGTLTPLLASVGILVLLPLRRAAPYVVAMAALQVWLLWTSNLTMAPMLIVYAGMVSFTAMATYRRDIIEKSLRDAADRARTAREELNIMVENAPDAHALVDAQGHLLRWNARCSDWALEVSGRPATAGESLWNGFPSDVATHLKQITRIASEGKVVDLSIGLETDPTGRRWSLVATPAAVSSDGAVFVMIREISEADAILADHQKQLHEARLALLHVASHELATPLTPLSMEASLLASSRLGPLTPAQGQAVAVILRNVERLRRFVQNLSKANDLEHNPPVSHPERITLAEVLDEAAVEAANIHGVPCPVVGTVDPGLDVVADHDLLRSAIVHLVENAATHAPRNTDVVLEAEHVDGVVTIHVHDQGAVPKHDPAARLFEPFYEDWKGSDERSHGLSLHLASTCMGLMGGKLEVCQEHSDACFALSFSITSPRRSVATQRPPRPTGPASPGTEADFPARHDDV